jgi:uncharacterized Rossmann fold enzyme
LRWEDWEPLYREIIDDFNYSREEDAKAAKVLNALLANKRICDDACIQNIICKEVTVCGGASNLQEQLDEFGTAGTLIAADNATSVLLANGSLPDLIVTDLDGSVREQIMANAEGAVVAVHAHGDNIPALKEHVPHFNGRIVGTTQGRELGVVRNYGGFTDGDRAIFLARHFGATRIRLLGFNFEEPSPKPGQDIAIKRKKLAWARRLIFDTNPEFVELWMP